MKSTQRKGPLLLTASIVVLLVFGALLGRSFLLPASKTLPPPTVEEPRPTREVLLYFSAPDGSHLITETREIDFCPNEDDCLQATVQALISGPIGPLLPILPRQTVVRGVRVEQATATVDLSRALIGNHPGGSLSELFTVYGLANTLVVNFPHIRQVKLLVEGQALDTLKGHVGLREPLPADFSLARPPAEESPGRTRL
jgi:spore germination protein GerM